jgi:hypothetical protein
MAEAGTGSPTFLCLGDSLRPASAGRFCGKWCPADQAFQFHDVQRLHPQISTCIYLSDFDAKTNIDRSHDLAPLPNISIFTQISPVGSRKCEEVTALMNNNGCRDYITA